MSKGKILDDPKMQDAVLAGVKDGLSIPQVADLLDITPATIRKYMKETPAFLLRVTAVRNEAVAPALTLAQEIMDDPEADRRDKLKAAELLMKHFNDGEARRHASELAREKHVMKLEEAAAGNPNLPGLGHQPVVVMGGDATAALAEMMRKQQAIDVSSEEA